MPEITEREIEQSEESAAEYDQRIQLSLPGMDFILHQKKFICAGCGRALGYGPADGIGPEAYHPACAERESEAMRARNLKRAMG